MGVASDGAVACAFTVRHTTLFNLVNTRFSLAFFAFFFLTYLLLVLPWEKPKLWKTILNLPSNLFLPWTVLLCGYASYEKLTNFLKRAALIFIQLRAVNMALMLRISNNVVAFSSVEIQHTSDFIFILELDLEKEPSAAQGKLFRRI